MKITLILFVAVAFLLYNVVFKTDTKVEKLEETLVLYKIF